MRLRKCLPSLKAERVEKDAEGKLPHHHLRTAMPIYAGVKIRLTGVK
ncbi:hypothetical protein KCP76_17580 [Salmonella enterica subsp. enterica serovar Weltevreden]|nr:hypothetical protein KCP76_17580 [Salmonella enterica subsp. enterica serovar Weltevreden]